MRAIVLALKLPTILILAWAFCRPEEMFRPGRRYWSVVAIAVVHVLLAVLSLTGEKSSLSEMFVAFPLIWSVLLRDRLRRLLPSPVSIFLAGGLWGVLVEQQFAGPKMLAAGAVVQALGFGLYIFPVYGLYLAAPRLLFYEEFNRSNRTSRWQGIWLFLGSPCCRWVRGCSGRRSYRHSDLTAPACLEPVFPVTIGKGLAMRLAWMTDVQLNFLEPLCPDCGGRIEDHNLAWCFGASDYAGLKAWSAPSAAPRSAAWQSAR